LITTQVSSLHFLPLFTHFGFSCLVFIFIHFSSNDLLAGRPAKFHEPKKSRNEKTE
jgi:hypothetical protein